MLLRDARGHWRHETGGTDLSDLALPHSIQEVVRRRLEALSPNAQRLLQLAALLGREFDPDVLGAIVAGISPMSDAELVDQLADLSRRQILEETPSASFRFTHDRLRTAADASVAAERRPELHKHIGQVLETWHTQQGTLDRAYGQLAHHFERGNELGKALRYSDLAGEQAHQTHATHEALWHLRRAKQIEKDLGVRPSAVAGARRERMLGLSSLDVGDVKAALEHLIEATRLLGNPWPSTKGGLQRRLLRLLMSELGRRFLGTGSASSQDPATREAMLEAARAYERLTVVFYFATGDKNSVALGALGNIDLAEKAGGPSGERCLGYATVGAICSLASLDRAAQYYVGRARAVAREAGDPAAEAWALINIALVHLQAGRWEQVREADEAARTLGKEIGFKRRWIEGTIQLSTACFLSGRFAEAERYNAELAEAIEQSDQSDLQARVWCATRKAELALVADGAERALAPALEGVAACEHLGRPEWIYALGALALAQLRAGDKVRAKETADKCAEWIGKDTPIAYYNIYAYSAVAEVYFALLADASETEKGPLRAAAASAVKQVRSIGKVMPAGAPRAELWRGIEAARLQGNAKLAEKHFRKSAARAKELGMSYDEAVAQAALFEHVPVPAAEGAALKERALETFERVGAVYDARRLRRAVAPSR
jgi:hypothetical protein